MMVYCDGVEVNSKLGKLLQAFRCDRPSEWQMDEFIGLAEGMYTEILELKKSNRLQVSMHLMAGILSDPTVKGTDEDIAQGAIRYADVLLAELERTNDTR